MCVCVCVCVYTTTAAMQAHSIAVFAAVLCCGESFSGKTQLTIIWLFCLRGRCGAWLSCGACARMIHFIRFRSASSFMSIICSQAVVQALLKAKADPTQKDGQGNAALALARGRKDLVRLLAKKP